MQPRRNNIGIRNSFNDESNTFTGINFYNKNLLLSTETNEE
jgi:hypothetical protein